jgi:phosphotransferase system HPr-like phosphotransfer protein
MIVSDFIITAATAVCAFVFLVFADYIFAFDNHSLKIITIILITGTGVLLLHKIIKSLQFSLKNTAELLDSLQSDNSEIFLSAYELAEENNKQNSGSMQIFLLDKIFEQASEKISEIGTGSIFPAKTLIKNLILFSAVAVTAAAALLIPVKITSTVISRIFHPDSDIPPYSPYTFRIFPDTPSVIFGNSLELSLKISGPEISEPVLLKTKYNNSVHSVTCFNASSGTFTQKIEKITQPLEFWFTVGKARTKHHTVKLLLRPKIILAKVHVRNPEYTHLPDKNFFLSGNSLKVMRDSSVTLEIFSNRPLSSGLLIITDKNKNDTIIKSVKTGEKSIAFTWKSTGKASISAKIYDIRGTSASEPLTFRQFILKDNPPEIVINSPDTFSLATPDAVIKISGYAEDDIGLKRVNIVKTVSGYRDRMFFLGPAAVSERFEFSDTLDLMKLGLEPGNVIELYAEASDFNPSLDGLALSRMIKIKIISKKDYAEILRTKIHIDTVLKRYSEMMNAFFRMKKLLENSVQKLKNNNNAGIKQQILSQLIKTNSEIFDSIKKLIKEFPVYEMEIEQRKTLEKLFRKALNNRETLSSLSEDMPAGKIAEKLNNLLKQWDESEAVVKKNLENINDLAAYAMVMQDAARLKKIYIRQQNIVSRLSRFKYKDVVSPTPMLKKTASDELEISSELQKIQEALWQHAAGLNDKFWKLKQDAAEISERIKIAGIPEILKKAGLSAKKRYAAKAYFQASEALEKLKALLQENEEKTNCISKLASGNLPNENGCGSPDKQFRKYAEEILKSILRRECSRPGTGYGAGIAGADGYSSGSSSVDVPLFGPARSLGLSGGGSGEGDGKKGQKSGFTVKTVSVKEKNKPDSQFESGSEKINIEDAPFKYRKAVKNYFSD